MSLLAGIRVLDFGRLIAGPYCAALPGDLGADVIRVERVEGGEDRSLPPVTAAGEGDPHIRAAGLLQERPISGSTRHAPIAPHPVNLSQDPAVFARSPPGSSEHTDQILAESGYGAAAVAALRARRVV